ncbi:hypothetical protein BGZ47_002161, partial [Haplosporangium gracile]
MGYVFRGSIRTDGFRVQLLAFKHRELQDVRYRWWNNDRLPPRITLTNGGTDYYLIEIRNVITCKEAVPQESTLATTTAATTEQHITLGAITQDSSITPTAQTSSTTPLSTPRSAFFNLAVKSKAVYQPTFRLRRWSESEKQVVPEGEQETIRDIETRSPPLKGPKASVMNYVKELERIEERLKAFCNGQNHNYKRRQWDMERARHMEYQLLAGRLLKIVEGGLGIPSNPLNPVIIGVGLGKFGIQNGLSSLYSSFLSYLIPM